MSLKGIIGWNFAWPGDGDQKHFPGLPLAIQIPMIELEFVPVSNSMSRF